MFKSDSTCSSAECPLNGYHSRSHLICSSALWLATSLWRDGAYISTPRIWAGFPTLLIRYDRTDTMTDVRWSPVRPGSLWLLPLWSHCPGKNCHYPGSIQCQLACYLIIWLYDEAMVNAIASTEREVKGKWDTRHVNEEATVEADLLALTLYVILYGSVANCPSEFLLHSWPIKCKRNEIVVSTQQLLGVVCHNTISSQNKINCLIANLFFPFECKV